MTAQRIMIAGMPASGKSTFIAALRHVLLSADISSALMMTRPSDDERHLNRLQDRWLASETFERTREVSEAWVRFHVTDCKTRVSAEIVMPDLRGEVFERPAALGNCARDVFEGLTSSSGLLLFTNANRPDDANLISDMGDLIDEEPVDVSEQPSGENGGFATAATFQADLMPEEAKLVELLQAVNRRPHPNKKRRIAVAVSAWDVVLEGGGLRRSPAEWLAVSRPMLWQYVMNNPDLWEVRAYGVSAQGGQLPRDRDRLQAIENASERIIVIGDDAEPHDPSAPVAWLMASS